MRYLVLLTALTLPSCDSCLPESFRVTPARKIDIAIIAQHTACIQGMPCAYCTEANIKACHVAAEQACVDAGRYPSCGHEEPEGTCCASWR